MDQNALIDCRVQPGNRAAIVFIHGGSGDPRETWGKFPAFLAADPRTRGWDIYSYGYVSTGINRLFDLPLAQRVKRMAGVHTDPTVSMLVTGLHTQLTTGRFRDYAALTLVTHSLGGILAQQLLVDYDDLRMRVQFLFLMGVSSNGFRDKLYSTYGMPQIDEIRPGTPLITRLRQQWQALFIDRPPPFEYWAIAGDEDGFVPPDTSLAPFPQDRQCVVRGDHSKMKEPASADDLVVQFVLGKLAGELDGDRWGSARAAVERGEYQRAIADLESHRAELDEDGTVTLALAYESVGRGSDALQTLQRFASYRDATDAMGVLAGRLKRRWLVNHLARDGDQALALYTGARRLAIERGRHDQAYYHGINIAFLQLAYRHEAKTAAETARTVLADCREAPRDFWRFAAEAEAHLYLGNADAALEGYRRALACDPPPRLRERRSMYDQAMRVLAYAPGLGALRKPLDQVFD